MIHLIQTLFIQMTYKQIHKHPFAAYNTDQFNSDDYGCLKIIKRTCLSNINI